MDWSPPSTTDGLQLSGLGSRNLGQPQIDTSQHPSPSLFLFLISFPALCLSVVLAINDSLLEILLMTSLRNRAARVDYETATIRICFMVYNYYLQFSFCHIFSRRISILRFIWSAQFCCTSIQIYTL